MGLLLQVDALLERHYVDLLDLECSLLFNLLRRREAVLAVFTNLEFFDDKIIIFIVDRSDLRLRLHLSHSFGKTAHQLAVKVIALADALFNEGLF